MFYFIYDFLVFIFSFILNRITIHMCIIIIIIIIVIVIILFSSNPISSRSYRSFYVLVVF